LLTVQNGYAFDSKSFSTDEGTPLIRIRDLKNGFKTETRFHGTFDSRYLVNAGDLLIGMDGEFGCYEWKGEKALLNQRVCRLKNFMSQLLPKFLFYGVNSYLKAIEETTGFTTVKHISSKQITSINFPVSPILKQKRIVSILDEVFEGIESATANAERNLFSARELFVNYLNSVFIRSGEAWAKSSLEEIGRLQTGTTPKTSEKDNLGTYIPFIKPGDFREDGSLDYENEGLSELGLAQSRLIRSGSAVMVCIGATIGKAGFAERDISANQQINAVTPREGIAGKFLYYQMISDGFQKQVMANSAQATLPIINKTKWGGLIFCLPPTLREQEQLVSKFDQLSSEVQRLEETYRQKLGRLAEMKQAILQKAFSGELTAQSADVVQEAAE